MACEYINKNISNKIQWIPSNVGTIGTTAVCPEYRGICISEASGIFPVGMANCTCAVEHYKPSLAVCWQEEACTMCTSAIVMSSC